MLRFRFVLKEKKKRVQFFFFFLFWSFVVDAIVVCFTLFVLGVVGKTRLAQDKMRGKKSFFFKKEKKKKKKDFFSCSFSFAFLFFLDSLCCSFSFAGTGGSI